MMNHIGSRAQTDIRSFPGIGSPIDSQGVVRTDGEQNSPILLPVPCGEGTDQINIKFDEALGHYSADSPWRPTLRYHGGKWRLAKEILRYFPWHEIYVEPFCGAASLLMQKPRSHSEVISDLDGEIFNLFQVLREQPQEFERVIRLTPFSRWEFELAFEKSVIPLSAVERARRLAVRAAFGRDSASATTSRKVSMRSLCDKAKRSATPMVDWIHYADAIPSFSSRLDGVWIENKPAIEVMKMHDSPKTLHYCDPPYLPSVRDRTKHDYAHEMDQDGHVELLSFLQTLRGMVIISGYQSEMYNSMLSGWEKVFIETFADSAKPRTEVLWLSPSCSNAPGIQVELGI